MSAGFGPSEDYLAKMHKSPEAIRAFHTSAALMAARKEISEDDVRKKGLVTKPSPQGDSPLLTRRAFKAALESKTLLLCHEGRGTNNYRKRTPKFPLKSDNTR